MKIDQKGLTLLEVLLSILLLAVVLISFMGFMTQSAFFTQKNEKKLDTANIAQVVVNAIQETSKNNPEQFMIKGLINPETKKLMLSNITDQTQIESLLNLKLKNTNHIIKLSFKDSIDISSLIEVKVLVEDTKNTENNSETFTYIRR